MDNSRFRISLNSVQFLPDFVEFLFLASDIPSFIRDLHMPKTESPFQRDFLVSIGSGLVSTFYLLLWFLYGFLSADLIVQPRDVLAAHAEVTKFGAIQPDIWC